METIDADTGEVTETALVTAPLGPSPFNRERPLVEISLACDRVLANLRDETRPLDALPSDTHQVEALAKAFYAWWKACDAAIVSRMRARNSKLIGDPRKGPALALKEEHDYTFDEKILKGLIAFVDKPDGLTAGEYEGALRYTFDPSKTALNNLQKRGGKVAEIIALGVRDNPQYKLELRGGTHK